jgi:hypothetical protein
MMGLTTILSILIGPTQPSQNIPQLTCPYLTSTVGFLPNKILHLPAVLGLTLTSKFSKHVLCKHLLSTVIQLTTCGKQFELAVRTRAPKYDQSSVDITV